MMMMIMKILLFLMRMMRMMLLYMIMMMMTIEQLFLFLSFSYVFWLGDLNYRINETIDNIRGLCAKNDYPALWKHDQVE